ncbi:MATE family efflux transporter [Eubacteriales bacterium OttesenSCG-928-N13]|nr:MATE family efflux transporter [Eubacteriales bacterium OttesenSCG-928-N13]
MNESGTLDMTQGEPRRLLVRFAVPLMIGNACQLLYTLADSAVVGQLIGLSAFSSVASAGNYYWMLVSIVLGLTQGFGTWISQRFGAKDEPGFRRSVAMAALLSLTIGLIFSLFGVIFTRQMLQLLDTPASTIDGAATYLHYLIGGMLITFSYNMMGSVLRAMGNSTAPLMAMILASALNILLDIALVMLTPLGIAGVAIATLIAQLAACAYCLLALINTGNLHLKKSDFKPHKPSIKGLLLLGGPAGFRNGVIAAGGLYIQYHINALDWLFVAGVAAPMKIFGMLEIVAAALDGAVATFVAQNFGAKNMLRVKQGVNSARWMMLVSSIAIAIITALFGRQIMGLLITGEPEQVAQVMQVAQNQLWCILIGLPVLNMLYLYRSALNGMGNAVIPMLSGFMELGARLLSVMVLPVFIGEWGIYMAQVLGWPAAALLLVPAYYVVYKKNVRAFAKGA